MSAQYRFDSWTTDNGLPQNGVRAITQTPDGYLWFTTLDGLVRFDGVKFTVFNKGNSKGIINNRFWFLRSFDDGSVWAATEIGDLTIYRDGEFISYPASQIPGNLIFGFEKDENGEILINADPDFYYLRHGEFVWAKPVGNDGSNKHIHQGQTGTRWEVYPTETRQIKNGQTIIYRLLIKFVNFYNQTAYEDKKGGLWITDLGKLYYLYNGKITEYGEKDGITPQLFGHSFWEDADESIWFATGDYNRPGVGLIRFKDGKFSKFGMEQGLSDDRIFHRFKDREGTTWLATNRGLNRLRQQIITSVSAKDGLIHNEVYPLLKARDGSVYVGTIGGLSHFQNGKFSNTILSRGKEYGISSVQSLWEDAKGRLWVGAVGGLFVIENDKPRDVSNLFGGQRTVSAIYSDNHGNIWFGTGEGGIYQYRDDKIVANYTTEQGLVGNDVKFIHEAQDGTFWIGTYNGLSHFKDGKFTNYTINEGLPGNFVRSIKEDADGTFWIGTYDGGLARFKDGKFFNFNTENGLFNNGIFAIMEDKRGNFWMSSNKGIFRAMKQQLNDFADGKIKSYDSFGYGKQDGMLNTECNGGRQPSAITDKDGQIWFPTLEGISIVNPNLLQTNALPPPIEIEEILIDRQKVNFADSIQINPSQTYLDITYTALSLINSEKIRFRHKLEGLDEDWIEAGTRRTVNFSHLPPGNYTFTVTATNSDGVWNPNGKSIKIEVLAPFYRTWWFIASIILLVICVAFLIYQYRINQLRRLNAAQESFSQQLIESQEAERKRIAQELHDSLGQNLLVIKNRALLGLAAEDKNEQFSEIQESVTDALSEVRTIAYNLRPLHIERLGLTSTIEEMVENVEKASGIQINCDIAKIDNLFTAENEINFYRIIQECLNNIVKHSKADKASVSVFRENDKIILSVKDNGKGFEADKAKEKKGLGLNGISERVKILGGNYLITSEPGKGTTFLGEIEPK